jgi:hypothetical protein
MPGPACCLLLAAFSSSVVEAAIGAEGEVASGRAPVDYAGESKNAITFTLVPGAGLRSRAQFNTLTLSYTPRIFYRLPNALDVDHPLVLHQVGLDHTLKVGHRLAWASSAQLAVGQIDYTAAGVVFDPNISSAVRTSVTDILRTTATTGLKYQLGPRFMLNWEGGVEYTTTLDQATIVPAPVTDPTVPVTPSTDASTFGTVIPDSFQVRTQPGISLSVGRASHVGVAAELTYQWFKDTARYLVLSPELEWDTTFGQRFSLGLSGGVAYVWTLDAVNPQDRNNSLGGTGSVNLQSVIYRGTGTTSTLGIVSSLEWYFDPILGTSQPRAGATVTNQTSFGRYFTFAPSVAFYTVLKTVYYRQLGPNGMPLPPDPTMPNGVVAPDATLARVELPFSYQFSDAASFGFGVRAALRGPPIQAPGPFNEQFEFWAFLGLTLRAATSLDHGAWLPL